MSIGHLLQNQIQKNYQIKRYLNLTKFVYVVNCGDSVHFEKYNLDGADVELKEGLTSPSENPEIHKRYLWVYIRREAKKFKCLRWAYPSTFRPITQPHAGPNRLLKAVNKLSATSAKSV